MGRRNTVDAEALTFGVEIECTMPVGTPISVGDYHHGIHVPWLPEGWTAQRDGSIRHGAIRFGVEIVSPVLRGAEGLVQVKTACDELRRRGARVNSSCGFHVHVGLPETTDAAVGRVVAIVARHQAALYAVTGTHGRERGSYCRGIKENGFHVAKFKENREDYRPRQSGNRYLLLNLDNLERGRRPAVEFRVFSGTVKALKALTFVRIALGLVHRALEMAATPKWDVVRKGGSLSKKGAGQDAVKAMLGELGLAGTYTAGVLFGPAIADGMPNRAAIAKEAVRLAAKYDAGTDASEAH